MMPVNITVINNADSCPKSFNESLSPFAIYPNEQLQVQVAPEVPIGSTLVQNDLESLILVVLNKLFISTSHMLTLALSSSSISLDQSEIQKCLKSLCKRQFIRSLRFVDIDNREVHSSHKCYTLGWRGYGFLKSKGLKINLRGYIEEMLNSPDAATRVKKLLSAQQTAICLGVELETLSIGEAVFVPDTEKVFRPNAIIRSKVDNSIVFIESVRQSPKLWGKELLDKVYRMIKVTKASQRNIDFNKATLILTCENLDHMHRTMKLIQHEFLTLPFDVVYTTDTLIHTSAQNAVFTIKPNFWAKLFNY